MTPNGVMSTYLPLGVSPGRYRKLVVHILIDFDEAEVERSVVCRAIAVDRAVFVASDLEKYTSYAEAI